MLRSYLGAGLSLVVVCGAAIAGCDEDTTVVEDENRPGRQPPGPPAGAPEANGEGTAIAVRKLFLGGTDRNDQKNSSAWKDYGYNLDNLVSKEGSPNHCQPQSGGNPKIMDDGTDGVDNAFGKQLLPLILSLASDAQETINGSLEDGEFTIITDMSNLGPDGNYLKVLTRLYAGQGLMGFPAWDGSDAWPVAPELLDNPSDITTSKVQFRDSYVVNNTWVSGTPGTIDLALSVSGYSLTLQITKAVISMDLDATHGGATNGIIAGILETEALVEEIRRVAGGIGGGEFCSGTTIESLLDNLRRASDIPVDGVQAASKTCDGISIGLGFNGTKVQLGEIGPATEPGDDPCADGGGGSGGEAGGGMGGGGSGGDGGSAGGSGGNGG